MFARCDHPPSASHLLEVGREVQEVVDGLLVCLLVDDGSSDERFHNQDVHHMSYTSWYTILKAPWWWRPITEESVQYGYYILY